MGKSKSIELDSGQELQVINEALKAARKHKLEAEVVWSALYHQRNHPLESAAASILVGLDEWVK